MNQEKISKTFDKINIIINQIINIVFFLICLFLFIIVKSISEKLIIIPFLLFFILMIIKNMKKINKK